MMSIRLALAFAWVLTSCSVAFGDQKGTDNNNDSGKCEQILKGFRSNGEISVTEGGTKKVINNDLAVKGETHKLAELFAADDEKNLAVQKPFMVMNSAQKLYALILAKDQHRIHLPGVAHRKVFYYPLFSDGLDLVKNNRVVGQFEAISRFVDSVRSQALGDKSGNSPTLLEGPHGTGKSEFLKIIRHAYIGLTSDLNSPFATYTYEFIGLEKIPGVKPFVNIVKDAEGREVATPRKSPMNHSPVALLPPELQKELFKRVSPKVEAMTNGLQPLTVMEPDPQSRFIVDEILLHYRSLLKRELTQEETVAFLNEHVRIRRVVFGAADGTLPTVEFQGNDIDTRGLFMAPDAMNMMVGEGPGHPMSWRMNGKVLLGNDNVILMDEVLRNSEEFLNFLLAIMESRIVDLGGSPRVPFDSVMLAATNEANTNAAKKDEKAAAQLDRFSKVLMDWPVRPHEVAETMLYMKAKGLIAKPLHSEPTTADATESSSDSDKEVQVSDVSDTAKITLRDIFPIPEPDRPVLGPDGRFRLWYREGNSTIDVSPHALMFLSEVVAATRVKTSIQGYEEVLAPYKIVNDPLFKSETMRILMHEGLQRVNLATSQELDEVTTKIKEGNTGISSRDAGRWLTEVLNAARTPENRNTVTVDLVMRVFKRMLAEDQIRAPSIAENARWSMIARQVAKDITLGRLRADIQQAIASNSNNLETAYDEVMEELKALDEDPQATSITHASGVNKQINMARLTQVREYFQRSEGRPLVPGKILVAVHSALTPSRVLPKHPGLLAAIRDYYAELETQRTPIDSLYETVTTGEGNDERKAAAREFMSGMERLGYSEYAAIMALETAKQWKDDLDRKP